MTIPLRAKDIMHNITVIPPDMSVQEAARVMAEKSIGSVLVKVGENDYGMVTERDILKKVTANAKDPSQLSVKEIMSHPLITVDVEADIFKIAGLFTQNNIRRLPVTREGEIVGILTTRDVTRSLMRDFYAQHPLFREMKEYKKKG